MEMLAFPDIKMCRNGQIGKKGCLQKKGMLGKLADIDVSVQHVADMSPTFPTKSGGNPYPNADYPFPLKSLMFLATVGMVHQHQRLCQHQSHPWHGTQTTQQHH
jgi:hypothetical protein